MMGTIPAQESEFNMDNFIKKNMSRFKGKGGGKKDYGQGFINNENLDVNDVKTYLLNKLDITKI